MPEETAWISVGTDLTATVAGLDDGVAQTFQVQAVNEVGPGGPNETTATVLELPLVSVEDGRADERGDRAVAFKVVLSRSSTRVVSVDYATVDGSAKTGEDYERTVGTLVFPAGVTEQAVLVRLLRDARDEGEETFAFMLSNARNARIGNGEATGTIENSDPLPKIWLSRFGRTVADHVSSAVSDRLAKPLSGAQVTVGGQSVDLTETGDEAWLGETMTALARALGAPEEPGPDGGSGSVFGTGSGSGSGSGSGTGPGLRGSSAPDNSMTRDLPGRELLLGSAFNLARAGNGTGPGLAAWGRVTAGGFDGEAPADGGSVRFDSNVVTGILGADAEWNRLLAGVAVSVSEGEGKFDQPGVDNGTIESTMTTVSPYARLMVNERVSVWGLAGWGTGDMTIVQAANDRGQPERTTRTDLAMRLAALGGRGALLTQDEAGGIDLALKADAFHVETEAKAVSNEGDTTVNASRMRLALEGGRAFALEGGTLRPSLELGLRHDGGDAETGTGVELGGGVSYAHPATGLSVEAKARMLVAHADSDYEEWGVSGAVRLAPGERGRGLSFSLSPTLGATSSASGPDLGRAAGSRHCAGARRVRRRAGPPGRDWLRALPVQRPLHRHAEPGLRALGRPRARLQAGLAADVRRARRPRLRGQPRRDAQGARQRQRAARARREAPGRDQVVGRRPRPAPPRETDPDGDRRRRRGVDVTAAGRGIRSGVAGDRRVGGCGGGPGARPLSDPCPDGAVRPAGVGGPVAGRRSGLALLGDRGPISELTVEIGPVEFAADGPANDAGPYAARRGSSSTWRPLRGSSPRRRRRAGSPTGCRCRARRSACWPKRARGPAARWCSRARERGR